MLKMMMVFLLLALGAASATPDDPVRYVADDEPDVGIIFQRGVMFDVDQVQRAGVNTGNAICLYAIVGVLQSHKAQLTPQESLVDPRDKQLAEFVMAFWKGWCRVTKRLSVALGLKPWELPPTLHKMYRMLFLSDPSDTMMTRHVESLNSMVNELGSKITMTQTTALLLVACYVTMTDTPVQHVATDLNQQETAQPIVLHTDMPFALEVALYRQAMLLEGCGRHIQEMGKSTSSDINVVELEPLAFLIDILCQIPHAPLAASPVPDYLELIPTLEIFNSCNANVALALGYHMAQDKKIAYDIALDIFSTGRQYDILKETFSLDEPKDSKIPVKTDMLIWIVQSLIESTLRDLQHPYSPSNASRNSSFRSKLSATNPLPSTPPKPKKIRHALKKLFGIFRNKKSAPVEDSPSSKSRSSSRSSSESIKSSRCTSPMSPPMAAVSNLLEHFGFRKPSLDLIKCAEALKASVQQSDVYSSGFV